MTNKSPEELAEEWFHNECKKNCDAQGEPIGGWDDPLIPDSCHPEEAFLAGMEANANRIWEAVEEGFTYPGSKLNFITANQLKQIIFPKEPSK